MKTPETYLSRVQELFAEIEEYARQGRKAMTARTLKRLQGSVQSNLHCIAVNVTNIEHDEKKKG